MMAARLDIQIAQTAQRNCVAGWSRFLQPSTSTGTLGRLGHYEIESVIGRGRCGIVLKAFDETPAGASRTARRAARATMPTPAWRSVD